MHAICCCFRLTCNKVVPTCESPSRSCPRSSLHKDPSDSAIASPSSFPNDIEATLAILQAWDLNHVSETMPYSKSNATYYHPDFVNSNSFEQAETGPMDVDLKPRPLRMPQQYVESCSTQPPQSAVTENSYDIWGNLNSASLSSISELDFGEVSPASIRQSIGHSGFEILPVMGVDYGSSNGQFSYPELNTSNIAYETTLGRSQLQPLGSFHDNSGWMEGTMFDPSPVGSDCPVLPGDNFSPVSPFSMPSSQLPESASSGSSLSGSFSGMEQHYSGHVHHPHTVGSGPGIQPPLQCATHQAASSRQGAKQQARNGIICCPICNWAPQPGRSWTEKEIKQSVNKHRHRKHSGVIYRCPMQECDKTFTRSDNVRPHVRREHPGFDMGLATPRRTSAGKRRSSVATRGF